MQKIAVKSWWLIFLVTNYMFFTVIIDQDARSKNPVSVFESSLLDSVNNNLSIANKHILLPIF